MFVMCLFSKIVFVDPTNEEESLATGSLTVVTLEGDKLCMVHKPGNSLGKQSPQIALCDNVTKTVSCVVGGSSLSEQQLQHCINRSHSRWGEINTLITDTINSVDR